VKVFNSLLLSFALLRPLLLEEGIELCFVDDFRGGGGGGGGGGGSFEGDGGRADIREAVGDTLVVVRDDEQEREDSIVDTLEATLIDVNRHGKRAENKHLYFFFLIAQH
jgi:hypothetical protein